MERVTAFACRSRRAEAIAAGRTAVLAMGHLRCNPYHSHRGAAHQGCGPALTQRRLQGLANASDAARLHTSLENLRREARGGVRRDVPPTG